MIRKLLHSSAVAIIIAAALSTPASAQDPETGIKPKSEYPAEVVEIVERGFVEALTDSEAELLKTEYPELAAVTPDYCGEDDEEVTLVAPAGFTRASSGCATASGTHHSKTLLGFPF